MSQSPSQAVGQVSADGQFRWDGAQWLPIPKGEREPTAWTRPMQLAVAALLTVQALYGVVSTILFIHKDDVRKALEQAGSQVPQGMTEDQFVSFSMVGIYVSAGFVALLALGCAVLAYFGWRWAFWVVLPIMGLFSIFALVGIPGIAASPQAAVSEVLSLGDVALFFWMLIGAIKFGPWAMKRPGA